jgi:hypothetical protein
MPKLQDYSPLFSRKKVFIPAVPQGVALAGVFGVGNSPTTTTHLQSAGDQPCRIANINTKHLYGVSMAAANDEWVYNWRVPDELYPGDAVHVWAIWAPNHVSTTTATVSYDLKYDAYKVVDYDSSHTYTPETAAEASTAMSTDLDEAAVLSTGGGASQLTQYAPYRSMRGTINGGLLNQQDFVSFKFELDAAPTEGSSIYLLGIEIDYALRVRERLVEKLT